MFFHYEDALIETDLKDRLIIKYLNILPYQPVWDAMKEYAISKQEQTDQLWVLQHNPVYTRGLRCKELPDTRASHIPVISVDRGGLMTYHGPGQLIIYGLINLNRKRLNIKQVVSAYEQSAINVLKHYNITAQRLDGAPGVYIEGKKIASIGIRVKNNTSYHGLSVNIDMDLKPFDWINTCGFTDLEVTQLKDFMDKVHWQSVVKKFVAQFVAEFGYSQVQHLNHSQTGF